MDMHRITHKALEIEHALAHPDFVTTNVSSTSLRWELRTNLDDYYFVLEDRYPMVSSGRGNATFMIPWSEAFGPAFRAMSWIGQEEWLRLRLVSIATYHAPYLWDRTAEEEGELSRQTHQSRWSINQNHLDYYHVVDAWNDARYNLPRNFAYAAATEDFGTWIAEKIATVSQKRLDMAKAWSREQAAGKGVGRGL